MNKVCRFVLPLFCAAVIVLVRPAGAGAASYVVMTQTQAQSVAGPTSTGNALQPVVLADGVRWVLPAEVLTDPDQAVRWPALAPFPIQNIAASEFPAPATKP